MNNKESKNMILGNLSEKALMKQKVYDITKTVFNTLKEVLNEKLQDYNRSLKKKENDKRILLEYRDRGKFEAQLKVAGDMLVFSMHSNIFDFDQDHGIWKTSYVKSNRMNAYCGIINIYNFLSDSYKYNRVEDLGYLIARIFINKDFHFFVEGKRQLGFLYNNFENAEINKELIHQIIDSAILYSMEFELLVPPYENVKIVSIAQMNKKIESSKTKTGKRLGFQFNTDDISETSDK